MRDVNGDIERHLDLKSSIETMNGGKLSPAERTLRKSVSFCLPNDDDGDDNDDDDIHVPDRLLVRHVRRSISSAPPMLPQNMVPGATSQTLSIPTPPKSMEPSHRRHSLQTPSILKRSLSVPVGLTLANVLTKQRQDAMRQGGNRDNNNPVNSSNLGNGVSNSFRARRYSSSSVVKRRMIQRSEKEFNRVAAKVSEFCRRVEHQPPGQSSGQHSGQLSDHPLTEAETPDDPSHDHLVAGQPTITHRGRRYRASVSLSSSSADNHSDKGNDCVKQTLADQMKQDINANEPLPTRYEYVPVGYDTPYQSTKQVLRTNRGQSYPQGHNGVDNDDDGQSELNKRISKWLDGVNNSVVEMSLDDQKHEDKGESSNVTIMPLKRNDRTGLQ